MSEPRDACQNGHTPVDIEMQHNGPEVYMTAHCDACGYGLEVRVQDDAWDTTGESTHTEEEA
jgi:hypothetical protein